MLDAVDNLRPCGLLRSCGCSHECVEKLKALVRTIRRVESCNEGRKQRHLRFCTSQPRLIGSSEAWLFSSHEDADKILRSRRHACAQVVIGIECHCRDEICGIMGHGPLHVRVQLLAIKILNDHPFRFATCTITVRALRASSAPHLACDGGRLGAAAIVVLRSRLDSSGCNFYTLVAIRALVFHRYFIIKPCIR